MTLEDGMAKWLGVVGIMGLVGCGDVAPCEYQGVSYAHGDSFLADDGCNTCTCESGEVSCTEIGCVDDTGA